MAYTSGALLVNRKEQSQDQDPTTSLPPLLASSRLSAPQTKYAKSWYGAEVTTEGLQLACLLKERISADDYRRWWQVNQFVCSGKVQDGFSAGFRRKWRPWQAEVDQVTKSWSEQPILPLEALLVTRSMPIQAALRRAVDLAIDIRTLQSLWDGNHRTALLSMIVLLAEASVILRPKFDIIRAYAILSARHHPDNHDNWLDTDAVTHVRHAVFQLLRHNVAPQTADWAYLDARAIEIRNLPIVLSRVEGLYRSLQLRGSTAAKGQGTCETREDRQWAWKMIPEKERRLVKLIHPTVTEEVYLDVIIKYY